MLQAGAMFGWLKTWTRHRREIRHRWQSDALMLAAEQSRTSYYEAHRRAAAARAHGDSDEFWHWTKVAAEIARINPTAEMDTETLRRVVDHEMGKR
jgi:hypothetical protein